MWRTWLSVPQPMIAAVNGDAIRFGTWLAVACDIVYSVPPHEVRIASREA